MSDTAVLKGTTITEETDVVAPGNTQGSTTERTMTAQADLLKEYVAATDTSFQPWNQIGYIKTLPNPSDDIMRDFGTRIYDQDMPRDPQVYSTLSILTMALLAQGLKLDTPMKPSEPDYEQALTILKFCQFCHDNLRRSLPEIMYELTEGMLKMGHKVGELIYAMGSLPGSTKKQILLIDVKTKEHDATAFVVDAFKNVLGLVYVRPGQPIPTLTDLQTESGKMPQMVPRSKFVIPTHKPRNGDPRGTSHIRSVYSPWWKKQMWNPQHVAYVTRFAQPSAWAKLSKDAKDIQVKDNLGNPKGTKSIVQATTEALAKIKGGAVGSFVDTDVAFLEAAGTGEVIFKSYDHEDRQIAKGILMQTLTTEEAQHMARAAGSIHQDVFGLLIAFLRFVVEWVWRNEVLKSLVRYNFGEDAARRLVPVVSLGATQVQDIPSLMGALAQLALAGGIHDSMWPAIRRMLDLPEADAAQEQADQEMKRQQQQQAMDAQKAAAKAAITAPNAGGSGGSGGSRQPTPPRSQPPRGGN